MKPNGNCNQEKYDKVTDGQDGVNSSRREFLKLVGVTATAATASTAASRSAQASSDGYGAGAYGEGGFGEGTETTVDITVPTTGSSDVGVSSATLNGELMGLSGVDAVDCYFEWRAANASEWNSTTAQTLSSTQAFSATVGGLDSGRQYEFRAVSQASTGDVSTGTTQTFTTLSNTVSVLTEQPTDVTNSSATLTGHLDNIGQNDEATCYFVWKAASADSWTQTSTQSLAAEGSFSTELTGLSATTEYVYYAVVGTPDGTKNTGATVSFTTGGTASAPSIDRFNVSEAGRADPHADITVVWDVSAPTTGLSTVQIDIVGDDGTNQTVTWKIDGMSASDIDAFGFKKVDGVTFDVTITVTDTEGNTTSAAVTVTE